MLWNELLKEVMLHIAPYVLYSLHILLKDGECFSRTSDNCKSLVQDKCNIEIFLSPAARICHKVPKTCELANT